MFLRDDEGKLHFYPRVDVDEFVERLEMLSPLAGVVYVIKEDGDVYTL